MKSRYKYVESVSDSCEKCGMNSDEFDNIGLWEKMSHKKHDKTLCLNCVLKYDIKAPDIEELLFEDNNPKITEDKDTIYMQVKSTVGATMHSFPVERRTEVWSDPGPELTSAGPSLSSQEYTEINLACKKAFVSIFKPRESNTEYKTDYWMNYVKRYID